MSNTENDEVQFISYLRRYVFVLQSFLLNNIEEYVASNQNGLVERPLDRARKESIEKEIAEMNRVIQSFKNFKENHERNECSDLQSN